MSLLLQHMLSKTNKQANKQTNKQAKLKNIMYLLHNFIVDFTVTAWHTAYLQWLHKRDFENLAWLVYKQALLFYFYCYSNIQTIPFSS